MAFARTHTACIRGSRVIPVIIEVDIQPGLPLFRIIGLPDKQIDEARERVKSALKNSQLSFPLGKITVNLSPSDIPKRGTAFDLGIALGIIQASNPLATLSPQVWVFGELSLDGQLRPVAALPALLIAAVQEKAQGCIIPLQGLAAARAVPECRVCAARSLRHLCDQWEKGFTFRARAEKSHPLYAPAHYAIDSILGQEEAKRALLIALAGGHHLLLAGPPGVGKTVIAKSGQQLLPPLNRAEELEVAQIYALSHQVQLPSLRRPPFRSPHHTISLAGLLGGGAEAQPGEMSLAHRGILLLDEFPEYKREVMEALRQPLQDKVINLIRKGEVCQFPANCMVIASQNLCPCGFKGVAGERCSCSAADLRRYQRILSGPILDRFDLFCHLDNPAHPTDDPPGIRGKEMATLIQSARVQQKKRLGARRLNAELTPAEIQRSVVLDKESKAFLQKAAQSFYLSVRALHGICRVARTIADLAQDPTVAPEHLQEALQYRYRRER